MDLYWYLNKLQDIRRRVIPPEISDSGRISEALDAVTERFGVPSGDDDDQRPIFILSAGWGSGSTLLQRLLISSGELAVWGEPFDHAAFVQRICTSLSSINLDWPPKEHFASAGDFRSFSGEWTANLTPRFEYLRMAQRAFFMTWFGRSAREYKLSRWGIKEVRWTIDHARYLKWLFPKAKFLFIYRNLFDSYRSCKGRNWFHIWPNYKVSNIVHFGYHWRYLLDGFVSGFQKVNGMMVRYEDLVSGDYDLQALAAYLEVQSFDKSVFDRRLGARGAKQKLTRRETWILRSLAGPTLRSVGYM